MLELGGFTRGDMREDSNTLLLFSWEESSLCLLARDPGVIFMRDAKEEFGVSVFPSNQCVYQARTQDQRVRSMFYMDLSIQDANYTETKGCYLYWT